MSYRKPLSFRPSINISHALLTCVSWEQVKAFSIEMLHSIVESACTRTWIQILALLFTCCDLRLVPLSGPQCPPLSSRGFE